MGDAADVAQSLQGRAARDGQRSRFGVVQRVGLQGGGRLVDNPKPGVAPATPRVAKGEDRIARLKLIGAGARRYDVAGDVRPWDIGEAQADKEPQLALEDLPIQGVHAGGAHAHEDLLVAWLRIRQVAQLWISSFAVAVDGNRFHGSSPIASIPLAPTGKPALSREGSKDALRRRLRRWQRSALRHLKGGAPRFRPASVAAIACRGCRPFPADRPSSD